MKSGNYWVLACAALAASSVGGLSLSWVPDAGAGISAALLGGLSTLMLGGWLTAERAPAR